MKKLFVSAMFIGLASVAIADNPPVNDKNDSCADRGVSVNTYSHQVKVSNNSDKPADYNMTIRTNNGNSYNYDSRNDTGRSDGMYKGEGAKGFSSDGNGTVKEVDIKCYDKQ